MRIMISLSPKLDDIVSFATFDVNLEMFSTTPGYGEFYHKYLKTFITEGLIPKIHQVWLVKKDTHFAQEIIKYPHRDWYKSPRNEKVYYIEV